MSKINYREIDNQVLCKRIMDSFKTGFGLIIGNDDLVIYNTYDIYNIVYYEMFNNTFGLKYKPYFKYELKYKKKHKKGLEKYINRINPGFLDMIKFLKLKRTIFKKNQSEYLSRLQISKTEKIGGWRQYYDNSINIKTKLSIEYNHSIQEHYIEKIGLKFIELLSLSDKKAIFKPLVNFENDITVYKFLKLYRLFVFRFDLEFPIRLNGKVEYKPLHIDTKERFENAHIKAMEIDIKRGNYVIDSDSDTEVEN